MDDLIRDIVRMERIGDDHLGLERFPISARFNDFVSYFFTRFLTNLRLSFKDYSKSELESYNERYKAQLQLTFKDPLLKLSGVIVPVPKGMMDFCLPTLNSLLDILEKISVKTLSQSLGQILIALNKSDVSLLQDDYYGKKNFEVDKTKIGSLYSKNGLTHKDATSVFTSIDDLGVVNAKLRDLIKEYYPEAIRFTTLINSIEHEHTKTTIPPEQMERVKAVLMDTAYRVSIFAIVLTHIQDMEHAMVKILETYRNLSKHT